MAIKIEVSADVRQALSSLSKFSNEIDKAGGVTEAMARQIAAALNLAAAQFTKLDNVKVDNPIAFVTQEVSNSVNKLVVALGEASNGINRFNTTKVENPLEGVPAQANASADQLTGVFEKLQQNVNSLDFTASINEAKLRLGTSIDDLANKALGLNEAFGSIKGDRLKLLQSAFIETDKPVEQLTAEINVLRDAIAETTNPLIIAKFASQITNLQEKLSNITVPKITFESVTTTKLNAPFVAADASGLKNFTISSTQSIVKLQEEIQRVETDLSEASNKGGADIDKLKARIDELKATLSRVQTNALQTAFQDAVKPVQQLENEITALQQKIVTSVDPKEIQSFASRVDALQIQLSNVKFGGINLDTSSLTAFQSAFIEAVKPVQQLEAEIKALQEAIEVSTNPTQIKVLNDQVKKLQTQLSTTKTTGFEGALSKLNSSAGKAVDGLNKIPSPTNRANLAILNLGRVLQDAPFGFLGIANNLNPLLESFQRLQGETKSVGATMKALGASILGAGGVGLALSAVQFFALGGGDALKKFIDVLRGFFGAAQPLVNVGELLSNTFKKAGEAAGPEVAKLEIFKTKLNDLNIPANERVKIAKAYNEIADKQNQIDSTQINNLDLINRKIDAQNKLILQRAVSTAAVGQLGSFADEFTAKVLEVRQAIADSPIFKDVRVQDEKDVNKRFEIAEKLFADKAKEFIKRRDDLLRQVQDQKSVLGVSVGTKTRFGIEQEQDKLNDEIKRTLGAQGTVILDAIDARDKAAAKLQAANNALAGLITPDGLTKRIEGGANKKPKFNFFDEFISFDPKKVKNDTEEAAKAFAIFSQFALERQRRFIGLDEIFKIDGEKGRAAAIAAAAEWWNNYQKAIKDGTLTRFFKVETPIDVKPLIKFDAKKADEEIEKSLKELKTKKIEIEPTIKNTTNQAPRIDFEQFKKQGEEIGRRVGSGFDDVFGKIFEDAFNDAFGNKNLRGDELEAFKKQFEAVSTIAAQGINAVADSFAKFGDELLQGKANLSSFADALKQSFRAIAMEIIRDIILAAILSAIKAATGGQGADISFIKNLTSIISGSHAAGLWRVPKDGYIAELHEGETVLPRSVAEQFRSMKLFTPSFTKLNLPKTLDINFSGIFKDFQSQIATLDKFKVNLPKITTQLKVDISKFDIPNISVPIPSFNIPTNRAINDSVKLQSLQNQFNRSRPLTVDDLGNLKLSAEVSGRSLKFVLQQEDRLQGFSFGK